MNAYEILADQVLQKIRSGVVPWRQLWKGGNPSNFVSGKEYRGFNRLVLSFSEHEDLRYLTAKQISSLGGAIKKGAKDSKIFFFKLEDIEGEKASYVQKRKINNILFSNIKITPSNVFVVPKEGLGGLFNHKWQAH